MYELAVIVLRDYIADLEKDIRPHYRKRHFEKLSYTRWAAYELLFAILDNSDKHPIDVIEEFACYMTRLSDNKSEKKRVIFSVALHVAEDILDIFHAMY